MEIEYTVIEIMFQVLSGILILIVAWFWGLCSGQSKMRKKHRSSMKKTLLEIDNINSNHGSIRDYIKPLIDKIIMSELKESIKNRKAWKR